MVLEAAKCPNCDGNVELDPKNTFMICKYCGSNIFVKDAINAYKEEQKKEYRLKIADECLEKGITEDAEDIYKEISKKFPNDYRGWWGIIKCVPINSYNHGDMEKEYKKALAFAPEDVKPEILENQKLRNLYVSKRNKLKRKKQIEEEINRKIKDIEENREKINEDTRTLKKRTRSIIVNRIHLIIGLCLIAVSIFIFQFKWWLSVIGVIIGIAFISDWYDNHDSPIVRDKNPYKEGVLQGESYNSRLVNELQSLKNQKQQLELEINEINKALNL